MSTRRLVSCIRASMAATVTAIVTVATGGGAMAQGRPPGLLNKLDLRTLVARGDPADHERLFMHFRVLWGRLLTDAERHDAMSRSFLGNSNRTSGSGMSEHCKRLADLNWHSAQTLRELALYYKKLAEGSPAMPPSGGATFEGGAGAPEPTDRELDVLAARARTRTDHLALEEYFRMLAKRYTSDANEHMWMASTYRGGRFAQAAVHHDRLASVSRKAAAEATRAAEMHNQFAAIGR